MEREREEASIGRSIIQRVASTNRRAVSGTHKPRQQCAPRFHATSNMAGDNKKMLPVKNGTKIGQKRKINRKRNGYNKKWDKNVERKRLLRIENNDRFVIENE